MSDDPVYVIEDSDIAAAAGGRAEARTVRETLALIAYAEDSFFEELALDE